MIRVGIYGYGNLGRGVEAAVAQNADMTLAGVFTRRNPESVKIATEGVGVYSAGELESFADKIDALVICGGSATDLPVMTPELAKKFNVIDSFDTHAKIPEHFANTDAAALSGGHIAMISVGWDPGMFSVNRAYMNAVLPDGRDYTFWGKGVSQGHSDAIRRIEGVVDARQYTVPVAGAVESVRRGENPELTTGQKHTRDCYVVAEQSADLSRIEHEIKTMPNYFADYDTTVHFITAEEMKRCHSSLPHGGSVIRVGKTGFDGGNTQICEFSLKLDSNPEFTGSVTVAYVRAMMKMYNRGERGCKTVFDVAPGDLCNMSAEDLRAKLL